MKYALAIMCLAHLLDMIHGNFICFTTSQFTWKKMLNWTIFMGEKHLLYIFDLFIMLNWMSTWIATHKSRRKIMSFVRYQSSARASNWTLFPRLVVQSTPTWIDLFPLGHTKHSVQMANHSKFMSFLFDKICRWFSVVFFFLFHDQRELTS